METDIIYTILFTEIVEVEGTNPVLDVTGVLEKDQRNFIGDTCLSLLSDGQVPKSLAIIPFATLNLKGLINYVEWLEETKKSGRKQAAIIILFKESDDLVFYKYIKIFRALLNEYSEKIIEAKQNKADLDDISNILNDLFNELKKVIEDLRDKEESIHKEEFPEDESEEYDHSEYTFKIIIAGDPQVGKTSLILRFTDKAFTRTYIPTLGVNITDKSLRAEKSKVQLVLWDIAGQSKFQRMRKHFYRGAEGIILVFDLTNKKSFESINKWYQDIKKSLVGDAIDGYIIGNKKDLEEEREVKQEVAENLAKMLKFKYIETSALTGENVMLIFHKLGEKLLSQLEENDLM